MYGSMGGHAQGRVVRYGAGREAKRCDVERDAIEAVGFDDDQAWLPVTLPGFQGYRLLQEYYAFPHRFLFLDVCGLGEVLRQMGGHEIEIVILLSRGDASLLQSVDSASFSLNCVPAINFFDNRSDRIHVARETHDLHVVPDRVRPMDFEIHSITSVTGYGVGLASERRFVPLYSAFHTEEAGSNAYYAAQREPRILSSTQRREGPRSSYMGTEIFLSLVDPQEVPYAYVLQQVVGSRAARSVPGV